METEIEQEEQAEGGEVPVCLHCLRPFNPLAHYCPHCGEAVGQLTPYLPFVNVRWMAHIWGKMWRQAWSSQVSIAGGVLRLLLILWFTPALLTGLIPMLCHKVRGSQNA